MFVQLHAKMSVERWVDKFAVPQYFLNSVAIHSTAVVWWTDNVTLVCRYRYQSVAVVHLSATGESDSYI